MIAVFKTTALWETQQIPCLSKPNHNPWIKDKTLFLYTFVAEEGLALKKTMMRPRLNQFDIQTLAWFEYFLIIDFNKKGGW